MRKLAALVNAVLIVAGCSDQAPTAPDAAEEAALQISPAASGNPTVKLLASDGDAIDQFGWSVSLDGDRALVGAIGKNAAYVFRWNGAEWVEAEKLTADASGVDWFGYSVSLDDDRAVVGAPFQDDKGSSSGAVYVFERNGAGSWGAGLKLLASDGESSDRFGFSVSLDGDRILVGAPRADGEESDSGSAYVFRWDGTDWVEEDKLASSDGRAFDVFGRSVDLDGDRVMIGAVGDDDKGSFSGSTYVFRRDGMDWKEEDKITASDGGSADRFGESVSLDGDRGVVGARRGDGAEANSGAAYVFSRDGTVWIEEAILTADDGEEQDAFGSSVSLEEDRTIVGAHGHDERARDAGSAYVFVRNGSSWTREGRLLARDADQGDNLGFSVAISEDRAITGARRDDDQGNVSGSAYVFDLSVCLASEAPDGTGPCSTPRPPGR